MAIEKQIVISMDTSSADKGLESIDSGIDNIEKSAQSAEKSTDSLSSSAIDGAKNFKIMGVSINGVSKTLKLLKVSLIATGIGAIVVVVGSLAAAFLSTQKGVDALNSVLVPLKTVLNTIWGIAQKLGDGLFQMASGDIAEGFDTMAKSVENLGDQLGEAYDRGKELYDLQIQIEQRSVNQGLVLSRLNRQYQEQLSIAEDITKTEVERKAAYAVAIANQKAITKLKSDEIDEQIRAILIGEEDNNTNREAQKERNDLLAQAETIKADGAKALTLLTKKLNVVKSEAPEETQEGDRSRVEQLETQYNDELEIIKTSEETKEDFLNRIEENRLARERRISKESIMNAEAEAFAKEQIRNASINGIVSGIGILASLNEESKGLQAAAIVAENVASIASTIINTQAANATIFAEGAALAIPTAGASVTAAAGLITANNINAGISVATSIAAAAKGLTQLGKSGNTGSASNTGSSSPSAPSFNLVQGTGADQIASNTAIQNDTPVKAYVVSSEVTTAQSLDRNAVGNATF